MRRVWFDLKYITSGALVDEVEEVLSVRHFDVEIFGCRHLDKKLPDNYSIVDYGSRETLAICIDGNVSTDREDIEKYEEMCC